MVVTTINLFSSLFCADDLETVRRFVVLSGEIVTFLDVILVVILEVLVDVSFILVVVRGSNASSLHKLILHVTQFLYFEGQSPQFCST